MKVTEAHVGKSEICQNILDDLPEWFGIPESKANYIRESADLPMVACWLDEQPVGFISLKIHTPAAAEMHVLGILRKHHRQGIGRLLVEKASAVAKRENLSYLTVKTIAPSSPNAHYAATRKFYEAMGFKPLEVFPTLWGPRNPCLVMIKSL